jgi:hypothetical protein
VVGREKFLKCDFFNYIKIKNRKKWESEKTKQNEKRENNTAHYIRRILYGGSPPPTGYYTDSGFDNDHSDEELIICPKTHH